MPGVSRTAVSVAAFLLGSVAWATAEAPPHGDVLRRGTALVFISDGRLDAGARAGSSVTLHLRDPLVLDGLIVAPAGAKARLVVGDVDPTTGKAEKVLVLEHFQTNPGLLPVRLTTRVPIAVEPGATIDATTLADVAHVGNRLSIETPFPFRLTNDMPAAAYTPTPARTANPSATRPPAARRRGATPTPTATPTAPAATAEAQSGAPIPGQPTSSPAALPTPPAQ
jgi:hypothetical protein